MRNSQPIRQVMTVAAAVLTVCVSATAAQAAVGSSPGESPQFNGSVYAIAYQGNTVYVGGSFTGAVVDGHFVSRQRLAAFDTRDGHLLDWAPRADGTVRALAASGSSVYAAGDFTEISGHDRDSLARIDGRSGAVGSFGHDVEGTPRALAVGHGKLYVGGTFSEIDGDERERLAAFELDDGELDEDWTPTADNTVYALTYSAGRVYLGGSFHQTDGISSTLRLSAVDADSGELAEDFRPKPSAVVYAIAIDSRGVYAAMGGRGGRAVSYSKTGQVRWVRAFDGDAQAIAVLDGTAYVGGHFDEACDTDATGTHGTCLDGSQSRVKLAAVTPSGALSDWAPQANGVVGIRTITVDKVHRTVAVGGDFTTIGGEAQRRYAYFG